MISLDIRCWVVQGDAVHTQMSICLRRWGCRSGIHSLNVALYNTTIKQLIMLRLTYVTVYFHLTLNLSELTMKLKCTKIAF